MSRWERRIGLLCFFMVSVGSRVGPDSHCRARLPVGKWEGVTGQSLTRQRHTQSVSPKKVIIINRELFGSELDNCVAMEGSNRALGRGVKDLWHSNGDEWASETALALCDSTMTFD